MSKMSAFKVEGFIPATFTPMHQNGSVNIKAIDSYQQFLHDRGIRHVYVNGSTGEGTSLTTSERKLIVEEWVRVSRVPGREMKILVQVGGSTHTEMMELTRHCRDIKVDAISALPSLYFLPTSVEELVTHCQRISEAAPEIPFYYYHIPDKTKVTFDMEQFLLSCRDKVPSLRGIKFSSRNLYEAARCMAVIDAKGQPFDLLFGCDEQVLGAMAMGFNGAIGSTYSLMPTVYQKMLKELKAGRVPEARPHQQRSVDLVKVLFKYGDRCGGPLPAMKSLLDNIGVKVGPVRAPMTPFKPEEEKLFFSDVKELGFFDWLKE